jgi:hypothetical protein
MRKKEKKKCEHEWCNLLLLNIRVCMLCRKKEPIFQFNLSK